MKITRYTIVYRMGIALDAWTAQLWDKLVARFPWLQLTQGVNSGAAASAGTHRGLGVLDLYLRGHDWKAVLRYAFDIGFFGWFRPYLKDVWAAHIHLGVRGHIKMAQSLKNQFMSWLRGRNGLKGDGDDFFDYRPASKGNAAPYKEPKPPKPAKPPRTVYPWFNVGFLNTWWNSVEGGRNYKATAPTLAEDSAAGSPAIVGFSEVRSGQLSTLTREMGERGYLPTAYVQANMLAAYHLPHVQILGTSFSQFKKQHGGNREGVLRIKARIKGSRMQVGFVHLDVDSPLAHKKHNVKEAYNSLKRYGTALRPDWKSRSLIMGDFNHKTVAGDVLKPLGFKAIVVNGIDQGWTGESRPDREGSASKTVSNHKRILARLGRYTQ